MTKTENFIIKANEIHGNIYDYSLAEYVNSKTKVKIICPEHGIFEQTPDKHIYRKQGCFSCCGKEKITKEQYIIKAIGKWGNIYDYSGIVLDNMNTTIKIYCKTHKTYFEQNATSHLKHCGCKLCKNDEYKNTYVELAKKVHDNYYDYSLVDYKNINHSIEIICPIHGSFFQFAQSHIQGSGCRLCSLQKNFIDKSNLLYNYKFDYSKVNYINQTTEVIIICPIHGEFKQTPKNHYRGECKNCADDRKKYTNEEFIEKCKIIHKNKYDYSLVNYIGIYDKIKIKCPVHGYFEIRPTDHLNNKGCPFCNESKGEKKILEILENNNIFFIRQYKFNECKNINQLPFDFYLPDYNICIEFDGIQHYKPVKYFGGINKLKYTQNNDKIKTEYCENNNIRLIRIGYDENIEEKLLFLNLNI